MEVLIAGDIVPQIEVEERITVDNNKEFFPEIKNLLKDADLSIVNLECPIIDDTEKPIHKIGPNLKCTKSIGKLLKYAGFDLVTLANNHFLDYGDEGAKNTIKVLNEYGIHYVGGGRNMDEASKTFYYEKDNKTLAIINCCESEFSIATDASAGSNPLNPVLQWYAIRTASHKADYVLVIVHGGHELYQLPSPRMQQLYRFFIDSGADAVINHHQHFYSGYELYNNKPIFYGLGNFYFINYKKRDRLWNEGYMVKISFPSVGFQIIPYNQTLGDENITLLSGDEKKTFFENVEKINEIITDEKLLKKEFRNLVKRKYISYLLDFLPSSLCKFPTLINNKLIIKIFLSKRRMMKCLNHIRCESHRDIMIESIRKYTEEL
ncbi:MAG: CapA family protein [Salinivirgaceae bacterium]|nr:CapA family protein [Salinivirgaceae bacterium]